MLTKKKQRRWLTGKGQEWLRQLKVFDDSHDQEALHRLRVEIKKIRALVRLAGARSGRRAAKDLHQLKRMFRQAGVIRDIDNQLRYLGQYQLLSPEFRDRQVQRLRTVVDKFAGKIKDYQKKGKKATRHLLSDIHGIQEERIRHWFSREIITTGILLKASGDQLHKARKKIKTLLYVQKILPKRMAERLRLNTNYLDRLQEAIGQWHDAVMATESWAEGGGDGQQPDDGQQPGEGQQLMIMMAIRECREREEAVRVLDNNFYRMVRQPG
jgi:CHAD domain-containing protein